MRYTDKPYQDRQFLMLVDDDRGMATSSIDVFTPFSKPSNLSFGNQRMSLNTLYIAHPAYKGLYVPFGEHEIDFITDKIQDLSHLCLALGALSIELQWIKGKSVSEMRNKDQSFGGSVSAGFIPVNASMQMSGSSRSENNATSNKNVSLAIKSSATIAPFIPTDLRWMKYEPQWSQMAKSRMLGAEEYTLTVSSSSSSSMSQKDSENLVADLKVLKTKIGVNYSSSVESFLSNSEETIWRVKVTFRPLSDYIPKETTPTSAAQEITNQNNEASNKKSFLKRIFKF